MIAGGMHLHLQMEPIDALLLGGGMLDSYDIAHLWHSRGHVGDKLEIDGLASISPNVPCRPSHYKAREANEAAARLLLP
jgi:hypothetical protein